MYCVKNINEQFIEMMKCTDCSTKTSYKPQKYIKCNTHQTINTVFSHEVNTISHFLPNSPPPGDIFHLVELFMVMTYYHHITLLFTISATT